LDFDLCYAPTYDRARAKFTDAAVAAGATPAVYTHPQGYGPGGETLTNADVVDAFSPVDQDWRDATIEQGLAITRQAVEGLAAW
jgi:uncharacterized protein DUF2817